MPSGIYKRTKTWKLSDEHKSKISVAHKGKSPWNKGKKGFKVSKETKEKISNSMKGRIPANHFPKGDKHPNWKGGVTPLNKLIRSSVEYKLWRVAVFERDNYTCIWCGSKGYIEADHIKPFAYYPELRFAIDNGRTLCLPCHESTDTYKQKANIKLAHS